MIDPKDQVKPKSGDEWVQLVAGTLMEKYGFTINKNRENLFHQILRNRAAAGLHSNLTDYCKKLLQHSAGQEWQILIDQLTIKETYFFRNMNHFHFLENHILPELMKKKWRWENNDQQGNKPSIRILSAGCSTGEEAYSIAISVYECIRYLRSWNLIIDAIDISTSAIEQARRGIFSDNDRFIQSIHTMNSSYLNRYFKLVGTEWHLNSEIKAMVSFRVVNLKSMFRSMPALLPKYDVIFCRNVMIYFNYADQCELVELLDNMLEPGGYIFMGDAEVLHIYNHDLKMVNSNGSLIYRKDSHEPMVG